MKLTENQIKELYAFTRRRLVEHYDLQTELVDHLANGIEQLWSVDPNIPFKEALQLEFKKFGHFGFRSVLKTRKKAINKKYNKLILDFYKQYFKFPKILLLLGFSLLCTLFLRNIPVDYNYMAFSGLIFMVGLYFTYVSYKTGQLYKEKIGLEKRWMLQEKILAVGGSGAGVLNLYFLVAMPNITLVSIDNIYYDFALSLISVCYVAFYYVIIFVLPKHVDELLIKFNPEYKFISKQWV